MLRRKFLSLGAIVIASTIIPLSVRATDFRETSPATWQSAGSVEAIKALFGNITPIGAKSKIKVTTVAIFQDANPRSAVAIFELGEFGVFDIKTKIKMRKTANVAVIAKGADGKYYSAVQKVDVSMDGCGG